MDEPFGALDPITREQLQREFIQLESVIQKTVIFVTHDIFEAVIMGDRVAILDNGKLQQIDTPRKIVEKPANEFVHHFLGQHRFQLSLMTRTIGSTLSLERAGAPAHQGDLPERYLTPRTSLLDALDMYKHSGKERLALVKNNTVAGEVRMDDVLRVMMKEFGTTEEGK
jgi:osmoprotectant transport system ATP-binding protein